MSSAALLRRWKGSPPQVAAACALAALALIALARTNTSLSLTPDLLVAADVAAVDSLPPVQTTSCAPFYLHCDKNYGDTGDNVEKNIKEYWDRSMVSTYLNDKLNKENLEDVYPDGYVYHHHYYHHHYGQSFYRDYDHTVSREHRRGSWQFPCSVCLH